MEFLVFLFVSIASFLSLGTTEKSQSSLLLPIRYLYTPIWFAPHLPPPSPATFSFELCSTWCSPEPQSPFLQSYFWVRQCPACMGAWGILPRLSPFVDSCLPISSSSFLIYQMLFCKLEIVSWAPFFFTQFCLLLDAPSKEGRKKKKKKRKAKKPVL